MTRSPGQETTKTFFIPKNDKNGHISAKEFRPISLTPFLPKTLEKLVDKFLKTGALVKHPLAPSQYAYRPGRSTETPLHHLVGSVEKQLETKNMLLGFLGY